MKNKKYSLSVVIPTYNERENIGQLITILEKLHKKWPISKFEIVVVDDNSPDGTAEIAKKLNRKYKNISVYVRRKKEGVGAAYFFGYRMAKGEIMVGMDADISHDPKQIPLLISEIDGGYDLVLGSRHIKGAYYERKKTETIRKYYTSKYGNIVTSLILGIKVKDFSNGFRCFRKKILDDIILELRGNSMLMEFIAKAYWKNYKVTEVPTTFMDRKRGKSKLKLIKEPLRFIKDVIKLKWKKIIGRIK